MSCPKCHEDNSGVIEGTITRVVTKSNHKRYYEESTRRRCPCGCEYDHIKRYELNFVCTIDKE